MPALRHAAAALVLVAAASAVRAEIDVEVGNGDSIVGTLFPAGETETFRVRCPAGAVLSVKAKAAKKGPALRVRVLGDGPPSIADRTGKSVTLKTPALGASAEYRVEVSAPDGTVPAGYTLAVGWKSATSFASSADLPATQTATLDFAADAGATATIRAAAGRGSAATPSLVGLTGPGAVPGVGPGASSIVTLTGAGSYQLTFGNSGAAAGVVTASVKVKAPKRTKRKLDLTPRVIGEGGAEGDAAFGSIVPESGATVTVPSIDFTDAGSEISGSSVTIPAGALGAPTVIFIATAPPLTPPGGRSGAGPTVFFGPEGTRFDTRDASARAVVTIPYDAGFESATGSFVVYTRDAKGVVTAVPEPYTFDHDAHTISFATSHFSSFRASSAGGPTDPTLRTVAFVRDPEDLCEAFPPLGQPKRYEFFAASSDLPGVFGLVARPGSSTRLDTERFAGGGSLTADGTPRLEFSFPANVIAVCAARNGIVFAATARQIFRIAADGTVALFAGTGALGDDGDGGPATAARFTAISSLAVALEGELFLCDSGAFRIRQVDSGGNAQAWAGTGTSAFGTDGVAPALTTFLAPRRIALARAGGLFVTDGARVRRIDPADGTNATFAGNPFGGSGSGGDGGPLAETEFYEADGIATFFDEGTQKEFVAVSDANDATVHLLDAAGDLMTFLAGESDSGGNAPDAPGPVDAAIRPSAVLLRANGVYIVDRFAGKIRLATR